MTTTDVGMLVSSMKFTVLLSVILIATKPGFAKELKSWKDVLQEDSFWRFLTFAVETKRLDILLPDQCLADNREVMQQFMKGLHLAARLSTQYDCTTRTCDDIHLQASSILVILCGSEIGRDLEPRVSSPYINTIVVAPDELISKAHSIVWDQFGWTFYNRFMSGGYAIITAVNETLMLTKNMKTECLTCNDSPLSVSKTPLLLRQVSLRGNNFTAHCWGVESCLHPSYTTIITALRHRGGRIDTNFESDTGVVNPVDTMQTQLLIHAVDTVHGYPRNVIVHSHYPYKNLVFCRRRQPIPKEAVLVLPFTWRVWVTLLSAFLMSMLSLFLILRIIVGKAAHLDTIAFSVVALLLHQSDQLPRSFRNHVSTRVIMGVWALMSLIIGTGFKGTLTALLKYVPLEGEIPDGVSIANLLLNHYTLCLIGDKKLIAPGLTRLKRRTALNSHYQDTRKFCDPLEGKDMNDGTMRVILMAPPPLSPNTKQIINVVRDMGKYVPLRYSQKQTYTIMKAASPYKKAVASTLLRARETGLFERTEKLKALEIDHGMWDGTTTTAQEVLTVNDVKPYFLALFLGLVTASLVLLFEVCVMRRPSCVKFRAWKRRLWRGLTFRPC